MKEDKEIILAFHDCCEQEKERRRTVLRSASRVIQQSSRELVLACVTCLLVVAGSVMLIVTTMGLLELGDRPSPQALPHHGEDDGPRLSFVSLGEDCDGSPTCRCAVASAARLDPRISCHVYDVLDDEAGDPPAPSASGLASLPNVRLHRNTSSRYFRDSPLDGWWPSAPPGLRSFAARVLALWRYGGVSLDSGVVSLAGGAGVAFGDLSGKAVLLDAAQGRVLTSPGPCHAFLFELMRSLGRAEPSSDVGDVIADTLGRFCGGDSPCPGVRLVPRDAICDAGPAGDAPASLEDVDVVDGSAPNATSPEVLVETLSGEVGETTADAIVVMGSTDQEITSSRATKRELLMRRVAHASILRRQACTWAALNDTLMRQTCPEEFK